MLAILNEERLSFSHFGLKTANQMAMLAPVRVFPPQQHCETGPLNILYVLRINPDLIKALQYNFHEI